MMIYSEEKKKDKKITNCKTSSSIYLLEVRIMKASLDNKEAIIDGPGIISNEVNYQMLQSTLINYMYFLFNHDVTITE